MMRTMRSKGNVSFCYVDLFTYTVSLSIVGKFRPWKDNVPLLQFIVDMRSYFCRSLIDGSAHREPPQISMLEQRQLLNIFRSVEFFVKPCLRKTAETRQGHTRIGQTIQIKGMNLGYCMQNLHRLLGLWRTMNDKMLFIKLRNEYRLLVNVVYTARRTDVTFAIHNQENLIMNLQRINFRRPVTTRQNCHTLQRAVLALTDKDWCTCYSSFVKIINDICISRYFYESHFASPYSISPGYISATISYHT